MVKFNSVFKIHMYSIILLDLCNATEATPTKADR